MKPVKSLSHELPAELPAGEHVLWQGAPGFWPVAKLFRIRGIALYFLALLAWVGVTRFAHHPAPEALASLLRFAALSAACLGIVAAYAYLVSATTSYTFTTRRLVLQVGVALPVSVNIPWEKIARADVKRRKDGAGEIRLSLLPGEKVNFVMLWPHVAGGKTGARPTLLALPQVDTVARIMARQLVASADLPAASLDVAGMSAADPSPLPHAALA